MEHTKWNFNGQRIMSNQVCIAIMQESPVSLKSGDEYTPSRLEMKSNGDRIVKCWNSHDELLEALELARQELFELNPIKHIYPIEQMDANAEVNGVWWKIMKAINNAK